MNAAALAFQLRASELSVLFAIFLFLLLTVCCCSLLLVAFVFGIDEKLVLIVGYLCVWIRRETRREIRLAAVNNSRA